MGHRKRIGIREREWGIMKYDGGQTERMVITEKVGVIQRGKGSGGSDSESGG